MLTEAQESELYVQLVADDSQRNRENFVYTFDALEQGTLGKYVIWPESNETARRVIEEGLDYNSVPFDEDNEISKGSQYVDQRRMIQQNQGKEVFCEALGMRRCLQKECPLYFAEGGLCREFKMVFRKSEREDRASQNL